MSKITATITLPNTLLRGAAQKLRNESPVDELDARRPDGGPTVSRALLRDVFDGPKPAGPLKRAAVGTASVLTTSALGAFASVPLVVLTRSLVPMAVGALAGAALGLDHAPKVIADHCGGPVSSPPSILTMFS